jgi:hypothetical protein
MSEMNTRILFFAGHGKNTLWERARASMVYEFRQETGEYIAF